MHARRRSRARSTRARSWRCTSWATRPTASPAADIGDAVSGLVAEGSPRRRDGPVVVPLRSRPRGRVRHADQADRARRHYGVAKWMETHEITSPVDVDRMAHHFATSATLIDELGFVADMPAEEIQDAALEVARPAISSAEAGELSPVVVKLSTLGLGLRHAPPREPPSDSCSPARTRSHQRSRARPRRRSTSTRRWSRPEPPATMHRPRRGAHRARRSRTEGRRRSTTRWPRSTRRSRCTAHSATTKACAESLRTYGLTRMFTGDHARAPSTSFSRGARDVPVARRPPWRGVGAPEPRVGRLHRRRRRHGRGVAERVRRRRSRRFVTPAVSAGLRTAGVRLLPPGPPRRSRGDGRTDVHRVGPAAATGGPRA